jgi:peptide/nickel transport system permease protein
MKHRFWRHLFGSAKAVTSTTLLVCFVSAALFAPYIAPYDPESQDLGARLQPPAWLSQGISAHPLGTDNLGRDILSRLLYGARVSLIVGMAGALVSMIVGLPLGLLSGYFSGLVDDLIMRLVDIFLAIPALIVAIALVAILKPNLATIVLAFTIVAWAWITRTIRAEVLSLKEQEFIEAARATGASDLYILYRHIFPNLFGTALVLATLFTPLVILWEAALSFLGLGSSLSWGWDLAHGQRYLAIAWWASTFPGLAIFVVVLALNLLGDWARDYMDVKID